MERAEIKATKREVAKVIALIGAAGVVVLVVVAEIAVTGVVVQIAVLLGSLLEPAKKIL